MDTDQKIMMVKWTWTKHSESLTLLRTPTWALHNSPPFHWTAPNTEDDFSLILPILPSTSSFQSTPSSFLAPHNVPDHSFSTSPGSSVLSECTQSQLNTYTYTIPSPLRLWPPLWPVSAYVLCHYTGTGSWDFLWLVSSYTPASCSKLSTLCPDDRHDVAEHINHVSGSQYKNTIHLMKCLKFTPWNTTRKSSIWCHKLVGHFGYLPKCRVDRLHLHPARRNFGW